MARHSTLSNLSELCTSITDPRINRRKLHSLESIITISVCAVICGAESWNDIEDFGILKKEFFECFNIKLKFIELILDNYENKLKNFEINYFIIN